MIAFSRDVIRAVPQALREASLALGATNAETIWSVVLPYARVGITGAVLLSLGRALGETIAVTMVIGNRPEISGSLFSAGYTLPSVIANEFTEAVGNVYLGAMFYLGLFLIVIGTGLLKGNVSVIVGKLYAPGDGRRDAGEVGDCLLGRPGA